MDFKAAALERLRNYEIMRAAVGNLQTQIRLLKLKRESLPGIKLDGTALCASPEWAQAWLTESLDRSTELEEALERTVLWMMVTDRALGMLEPDELTILRQLYIKKAPGALSRVCQLLRTEKSTVYRKRDKALQKFTLALYGMPESTAQIGA